MFLVGTVANLIDIRIRCKGFDKVGNHGLIAVESEEYSDLYLFLTIACLFVFGDNVLNDKTIFISLRANLMENRNIRGDNQMNLWGTFVQKFFDLGKAKQETNSHQSDKNRFNDEATSASHTDGCNKPKRGSCCKTADGKSVFDNGACTHETHTGNDAGCDTGDVKVKIEAIIKRTGFYDSKLNAKDRDDHQQRAGDRDNDVGS